MKAVPLWRFCVGGKGYLSPTTTVQTCKLSYFPELCAVPAEHPASRKAEPPALLPRARSIQICVALHRHLPRSPDRSAPARPKLLRSDHARSRSLGQPVALELCEMPLADGRRAAGCGVETDAFLQTNKGPAASHRLIELGDQLAHGAAPSVE